MAEFSEDPRHVNSGKDDEQFVSADELNALTDERHLMSESEQDLAERLFKENLPMAVRTITKLANSSTASDTVRLKAAVYVTERVMGRLQDTNKLVEDPLEKIWNEINPGKTNT